MGNTKFLRTTTALFTVAGLAFSIGGAYAANVTDPGRTGERLKPQQMAPTVGAPIEIPSIPQQQAPEGASQHRFTLSGVSFEGNAAVSNDELQAIAKDYVGKEISLAQVFEMSNRVTAAYRARGYILARAIVPTQRISDGVLELRVVEGFIDKVTIEGDAGGARSILEEHGQRIAAVHPLTAATMERELLLA